MQTLASRLPDSKILLIYSLLVIAFANSFAVGFNKTIPQLAICVISALAADFVLKLFLTGKKVFSQSAIISGLFIGMVFSPETPFAFLVFACAVAMLLKHFVRMNFLNVFNPAVSGMLVTLLVFPVVAEGWWGYGIPWLVVLLGLLVCLKADRLYASLSFVLSYFILYLLLLVFSNGLALTQAAQSSFTFLPLFMGFLMLVDPMTSPPKKKPQIAYGFLAALFSIALLVLHSSFFLYAGLLAANATRFELSKRLK